jgi:hypothetical protein
MLIEISSALPTNCVFTIIQIDKTNAFHWRRIEKKMTNENKELRIIIAGGRDFDDYQMLKEEALKAISNIVLNATGQAKTQKELITIISGSANGADTLGEQFANECGLKLRRFPADWCRHGRRAGYMRNVEMAEYAIDKENHEAYGALIAFWDGQSKGTKHMIDTAKKMGLDVHVLNYDDK